jgi:aryl-alcohol dehydrogenase-like predicted oxidoreductase
MAQPAIARPIVSVTSVAQLDELAKAARVKLDAACARRAGHRKQITGVRLQLS